MLLKKISLLQSDPDDRASGPRPHRIAEELDVDSIFGMLFKDDTSKRKNLGDKWLDKRGRNNVVTNADGTVSRSYGTVQLFGTGRKLTVHIYNLVDGQAARGKTKLWHVFSEATRDVKRGGRAAAASRGAAGDSAAVSTTANPAAKRAAPLQEMSSPQDDGSGNSSESGGQGDGEGDGAEADGGQRRRKRPRTLGSLVVALGSFCLVYWMASGMSGADSGSAGVARQVVPRHEIQPEPEPEPEPEDDPCYQVECGRHGSCVPAGIGAAVCSCSAGWSGDSCDHPRGCDGNPCGSHGTCSADGKAHTFVPAWKRSKIKDWDHRREPQLQLRR